VLLEGLCVNRGPAKAAATVGVGAARPRRRSARRLPAGSTDLRRMVLPSTLAAPWSAPVRPLPWAVLASGRSGAGSRRRGLAAPPPRRAGRPRTAPGPTHEIRRLNLDGLTSSREQAGEPPVLEHRAEGIAQRDEPAAAAQRLLSPAGHGKISAGLMVGVGRGGERGLNACRTRRNRICLNYSVVVCVVQYAMY
jgi:hypothetical protein